CTCNNRPAVANEVRSNKGKLVTARMGVPGRRLEGAKDANHADVFRIERIALRRAFRAPATSKEDPACFSQPIRFRLFDPRQVSSIEVLRLVIDANVVPKSTITPGNIASIAGHLDPRCEAM